MKRKPNPHGETPTSVPADQERREKLVSDSLWYWREYFASEQHLKDINDRLRGASHEDITPPWED